jgi:hypothetical protein
MRIPMITSELSLFERSGGTGICEYCLSRELLRLGHDVEILTNVDPGQDQVLLSGMMRVHDFRRCLLEKRKQPYG